ncbi:hypothetical protein FA10DRAFT_266481 [Acaromyces ingoldii]|uniref:Zn(2)-C6 fungal-type domain-containing protein n=1 Tax=Acaromyces ingoldii TaxID=215250 RepID=A0A316YL72_9BASI|nr:hypothetical protein FA10DRAFT_266481 [Acaromyces ingoldii]PWN89951.1 hypothetical protein FA10DRAFT_266481 [Acaromyces ingoldii]
MAPSPQDVNFLETLPRTSAGPFNNAHFQHDHAGNNYQALVDLMAAHAGSDNVGNMHTSHFPSGSGLENGGHATMGLSPSYQHAPSHVDAKWIWNSTNTIPMNAASDFALTFDHHNGQWNSSTPSSSTDLLRMSQTTPTFIPHSLSSHSSSPRTTHNGGRVDSSADQSTDSTSVSDASPRSQDGALKDVTISPSVFHAPTSSSFVPLFPASKRPSKTEEEEEDEEEDEEEEDEEDEQAGDKGLPKKAKVQRRQGVTCDQCRSKHIRCVACPPGERVVGENGRTKCLRCVKKGLECTRNHAPPSRRYPRPSRTGKRIEQARLLHGSKPGQTGQLLTQPSASADSRLSQRVMAGSVSLRLLTCFFATAHMQMPIVDFHNFSARYNFSSGDYRVMSIMANGGAQEEGIPSARHSAPGLQMSVWPATKQSTLSTPETTETLIAVMHAWASLYTDMPVAFGQDAALLGFGGSGSGEGTSSSGRTGAAGLSINHSNQLGGEAGQMPTIVADEGAAKSGPGGGAWKSAVPSSTVLATAENGAIIGANGKVRRPKRKQGVACDTCRLRRLRCDKLERPEGMGCSRCEDKMIVCTDEYIQSKRKKNSDGSPLPQQSPQQQLTQPHPTYSQDMGMAIVGSLDSDEGTIGSAASMIKDVTGGQGPNSWKGTSREQEVWIDDGPKAPATYRAGRGKDMLAWGRARQPFFWELLKKALALVEKHNLKENPSVEAIQALMILVQIVDLVDQKHSSSLAKAAYNHLSALNLERADEVDEQDQEAVALMFGHMQRSRVWCSTWTRDAIITGMHRKQPFFAAERAIGIKGGSSSASSTAPAQDPTKADMSVTQLPKPKLNGEMGLSFSILALMQVGALSRFLARHIDSIPSTQPGLTPRDRFPGTPTSAQVRKLEKACAALWRSIDSLLLFFDRCALEARTIMDGLRPFQPLGWIANIKIACAMLDLATFRILGERHQVLDYSPSSDLAANEAVRLLLEKSRQRALTTCRGISRLVEFLLPKRVFQTGGILLRQILPVAQFLARTPAIITTPTSSSSSLTSNSLLLDPSMLHGAAVDPRTLFTRHDTSSSSLLLTPPSASVESPSNAHTSGMEEADEAEREKETEKKGHIPSHIVEARLGPFDVDAKKREVGHCIEALAQLGYAWPSMEREIASVEHLLRTVQPIPQHVASAAAHF